MEVSHRKTPLDRPPGLFACSLDGGATSEREDIGLPDYVPPRGSDVGSAGVFYLGRDKERKPVAVPFFELASGTSFNLVTPSPRDETQRALSSNNNQERAMRQSRAMVSTDTFSTVAVSSTLIPPK